MSLLTIVAYRPGGLAGDGRRADGWRNDAVSCPFDQGEESCTDRRGFGLGTVSWRWCWAPRWPRRWGSNATPDAWITTKIKLALLTTDGGERDRH